MNPKLRNLYLKPGGLYLGDAPSRITTVLGSCVSVTMFHRGSGQAAICHAVQPACRDISACRTVCAESPKYVNCILPRMVESFLLKGIHCSQIEIKLFGGATMSVTRGTSAIQKAVGKMNVEMALQCLESHGLTLRKANAGGILGRKIIFDTRKGDVWHKSLQKQAAFFDKRQGVLPWPI